MAGKVPKNSVVVGVMSSLTALSDAELVTRLPSLVQAERASMLDVIEHLVEMERRRLYLVHAASSLYRYCIDRLGYSEDAALKRHRVARLVLRFPKALAELRAGTIHLTGLFLLSPHLDENNAAALLTEARGKSRRELEALIACRFPQPDVRSRIEPMQAATGPETGRPEARAALEALAPGRWRVVFTASAELRDKLERARDLLSHAVPSGDLGELFERALDALLEKETRKRFGAGRPRKARTLKAGSRHVPVEVERAVWERDSSQCTFVDAEGRRCGERRFLTIEHRQPFALGGPSNVDNLCLLCSAHNLANAREVFGEQHIAMKIGETALSSIRMPAPGVGTAVAPCASTPRGVDEQQVAADNRPRQLHRDAGTAVLTALCNMGFRRREATAAVGRASAAEPGLEIRELLKKSLWILVPAAS